MNDFEGTGSFTSYKELSGITVEVGDVVEEISKLPLDGILGFLAGISLEMIQEKIGFFSPRLQGKYLQLAIVDEFPQKISSACEMYIPGRVPKTGGRHIFIHEQNMAWLCHAALLYSIEDRFTPDITHDLECRLFRILLIINDFLSEDKISRPFDLSARRIFTHKWLRHRQFNRHFGSSIEIIAKLARQRILMVEMLPRYYPPIISKFLEASGMDLRKYFEGLCIFVSHVHESMTKGTHWLAKETFLSKVKANKALFETILALWVRTPEQYRDACSEWRKKRRDMGKLPIYDFVPLRETPLIEGRSGELVCPVPAFLFAKIEDDPYFILSDYLSDFNKSEMNKFHAALGKAYEDYANELIERIAKADTGGKWMFRPSPSIKRGGQLADSYLQRGQTGVVFEHKGQRPGTEFLRGGEGDRVIGPSEQILKRLENGERVDFKEGYARDDGFITRGMWQQSKAGPKIITWAEKEFGEKPLRLFPLITNSSPLIVDTVVRKAYLNDLIQQAGLYGEDYWENVQWINVSDFESLAQLAEDGQLDLESLLQEKAAKYSDKQFDLFLHDVKESRFIHNRLLDEALTLLKNAAANFFGRGLKENEKPEV